MDLPCDDATANFSDYADVVRDALEGCDDDVILVGHSMGGQTVPLVADRRPVEHLVYLCALVPKVGLSLGEQLVEEPSMLLAGWDSALSHPDEAGRTSWVDMARTKELLYADCDNATVVHAIGTLRPQAGYPLGFPFPSQEFPAVPTTSVICSEDRMLGNDWARTVARERLCALPAPGTQHRRRSVQLGVRRGSRPAPLPLPEGQGRDAQSRIDWTQHDMAGFDIDALMRADEDQAEELERAHAEMAVRACES
jgi:pimeloyl-ACP methyl ester carboxylesterase